MTEQLFARLLMQTDATLVHEIAVKKVLIERVAKAVARGERAVGKFLFAEYFDQTMSLRHVGQTFFELDLVEAEQFRGDDRQKLRAFNARILQRAPFLAIEGIDLLEDRKSVV